MKTLIIFFCVESKESNPLTEDDCKEVSHIAEKLGTIVNTVPTILSPSGRRSSDSAQIIASAFSTTAEESKTLWRESHHEVLDLVLSQKTETVILVSDREVSALGFFFHFCRNNFLLQSVAALPSRKPKAVVIDCTQRLVTIVHS
ncbi:MAG: hypothetical protein HYV32_01685 [Candidatus Kerfeldbacteria bacterium]|nr:hypothetical protein [Candidatus Kerfeldbacteria bacterium]